MMLIPLIAVILGLAISLAILGAVLEILKDINDPSVKCEVDLIKECVTQSIIFVGSAFALVVLYALSLL